MNPETNRIEYKQELIDDLEKEVVAFLNYQEGGIFILESTRKERLWVSLTLMGICLKSKTD